MVRTSEPKRRLDGIQKMNNQLWILVTVSPSELWPRLKQFLSTENLLVNIENGEIGMIDTRNNSDIYRFKVEQGFQRNTSEVYIRYLNGTSQQEGFWPASSDDVNEEQAMIEVKQYLGDYITAYADEEEN